MMQVLLTCPPMISCLDRLDYDGTKIRFVVPDFVQTMTEDALIALFKSRAFDAWIIGDDPATRAVFEAATSLKRVVKWGAGVDNVDIAALGALGIPFTNTPGLFGESVSDVAVGMLLNLTRRLSVIDRGIRAGGWPKPCGDDLNGKKACIVGLGTVGQAVARKLAAFGCRIHAADPAFADTPDGAARGTTVVRGVRVAPLCEAVGGARVLVVTCELNRRTAGLIDKECLRLMAPDCYVINVSRGPVVDEQALVDGLRSGKVRGAGLDVFVREPLDASSPLLQLSENTILGSHNGSHTFESVEAASVKAIEYLTGSGC